MDYIQRESANYEDALRIVGARFLTVGDRVTDMGRAEARINHMVLNGIGCMCAK